MTLLREKVGGPFLVASGVGHQTEREDIAQSTTGYVINRRDDFSHDCFSRYEFPQIQAESCCFCTLRAGSGRLW